MTKPNYYTVYERLLTAEGASAIPLKGYFDQLEKDDWTGFFDDFYNRRTSFLLRILRAPRGEDLFSYGRVHLRNMKPKARELITVAHDILLEEYRGEKNWAPMEALFNTVRFLQLSIQSEPLKAIILDHGIPQNLRELAATTLSIVHENLLIPFWNGLDFEKDKFLIPSYIFFFQRIDPIAGLEKLLLLSEAPADPGSFKFPILYSLRQASISISDLEKYQELRKRLPDWASQLIARLFETYPDLRHLKEDLQSPFDDILDQLGLTPAILNDKKIPKYLRNSLERLVRKIIKKPEMLVRAKDYKLTIIDPVYIESIEIHIKHLKRKLEELGFGPFNDPVDEQVFEASENKTYYNIPTLFLYPYFLDENRSSDNDAGVIPYATQTAIAIVMKRSNVKYKEWVALRDAVKGSETKDRIIDRMVDQAVAIQWLKSLLDYLYEQGDAEIHSVRGYVLHSIIQQFAEKHIKDNKRMGVILKGTTDSDTFKPDGSKLPFYRPVRGSEKLKTNQILLLDPADAYMESENGMKTFEHLNSAYDIVYVRHGLDIPVGIGFSMFAVPRLLKNDAWRVLQHFMVDELKYTDMLFRSIGLRLISKESLTENTPVKHEQRVKS